MPEINRSLIVVTAKQPFLDWAHSIDPEDASTLESINLEPTAYLVPEYEMDDEQEGIVEWCADFVFEYELWLWCTDEELWPKTRDVSIFREWFDVKFYSMVNDIVADIPLKYIDWGKDKDDIDPSSNGH